MCLAGLIRRRPDHLFFPPPAYDLCRLRSISHLLIEQPL